MMHVAYLLQKRGLRCIFSPTKIRKPNNSRSAKDRDARNTHRRASTAASPTPIGAPETDADDNITVVPRPTSSANSWNAFGTTQPSLMHQVASESTNIQGDSALYVDKILSPMESTGTPEEVRSRYPEGCYSVSRQTVDEHG